MKTEFICEKGKMKVYLTGELDHHHAGEIMREIVREIDKNLPRDCILDLEKLSFMDSSGIAVILKTYKLMNEIDGRLWVENVPPQPMKFLDASGVDRIVRITAVSQERGYIR